jgi:uncharacterized protein
MSTEHSLFNEEQTLHELKHYLPAQAALKDFVHHNTLHAFEHLAFHNARRHASRIFGYKVSLSLNEFRARFRQGRIREDVLDRVISAREGRDKVPEWKAKMLEGNYHTSIVARIGALRNHWTREYHVNIDAIVHPMLFRLLCSFLDQGISIWKFPVEGMSFLDAIREIEQKSLFKFIRTERARSLLHAKAGLEELLDRVVGDRRFYKQYLFDQQFAHQGWSGLVSAIEDHPETLLEKRKITLRELLVLELILEIDTLTVKLGDHWQPLAQHIHSEPDELFAPVAATELDAVMELWQEAYEWSYYDEVLAAIRIHEDEKKEITDKTFQALFCIDDREASLRGYLELFDPHCETFSTPGFFNVAFYYKPDAGRYYNKLCPAPVKPRHLVKEVYSTEKHEQDASFSQRSHSLLAGWLLTQTLGFWAAVKLAKNIFRPAVSPAASSSFRLMNPAARLTIENKKAGRLENGLQIGFTIEEMSERVEGLLKSIGLVKDFAPVIYVVGHGASSVNNPHYAAYDCGACSGRPGSVNARVFAYMANHEEVRAALRQRGIEIPEGTQFVGGLHDTTRDDLICYDAENLLARNLDTHRKAMQCFRKALQQNAKERSRRFLSVDTRQAPSRIHAQIQRRAFSLFEPRPELNHATNALCIIAPRALTRDIFLDRRSFMNSYDYKVDPEGVYLAQILNAAAPVCGGINLEYFFSRVDNYKLGAGTKLPHNVMGLIGVANGIDGDVRPGLPSQMIEAHDPLRLLMVIEHFPPVVLKALKQSEATYNWFINDWIKLVVVDPVTEKFHLFSEGAFVAYEPLLKTVEHVTDIVPLIESGEDNLPVYIIKS